MQQGRWSYSGPWCGFGRWHSCRRRYLHKHTVFTLYKPQYYHHLPHWAKCDYHWY